MKMKKLIIANWKMNPKTEREAITLASSVLKGIRHITRKVDIVFAPPFPFLSAIKNISTGTLAAQDVSAELSSAYTGEVSAFQLKSLGVSYVIVGHSERRAMGESNEEVRKKIFIALKSGLRPVLCVGETEKKEHDPFPEMVKRELVEALRGIPKSRAKHLLIVYEPIWAISSHVGAHADDPRNLFEMSVLIRRELYRILGKRVASHIPVLYGGSVNDRNAANIMLHGNVDGLLVGKASLSPRIFINLAQSVSSL